ncbi:polysaccharide pyruvyl transferase family protein [Mesorhizobium sp. PAMC28654]|uniref:polysaccharide pyruvyl transferase family protein n=1 Tax=Mesorhizobium sp. PAMC28654 TaxID=2880934 RepID=UPI001D0B64FC|nr:polysaccharide pyruvyl transferase family protein [Mesorhizobium sp. PAMC28654]UDL92525.1 polysaccharide pyruvyl transferase family protein [Mesorhizobium sp. PAMC28654]
MMQQEWRDDTPRESRTTEDLRIALRDRIKEVLLPLISGRGERIHLIDPPDHPNVGDCAILLGELDFFKRELPGSHVGFHDWSTYSPSSDRHIERASVLLMHGGGNFGDIWPHHHQFRLKILRCFPNRPTIQLAQSIHFDSSAALQETREAIAAHSDFTLLARDTKSEAFARANFDCHVALCPDMAFAMDRIVRKPATLDAFCLLRTDKEAVAPHEGIKKQLNQMGLSAEAGDWMDDPRTAARLWDRLYSKLTRKFPIAYPLLAPLAFTARRRYAEARLRVGIDLLSRGRIVVTDRLHAHILSTLLDIPNVVFRSFDAKAAAFYDTWTHAAPICRLADDPSDMVHAVQAVMPPK